MALCGDLALWRRCGTVLRRTVEWRNVDGEGDVTWNGDVAVFWWMTGTGCWGYVWSCDTGLQKMGAEGFHNAHSDSFVRLRIFLLLCIYVFLFLYLCILIVMLCIVILIFMYCYCYVRLWKWVPGISPGVKAAGVFGWRTTTLVVPKVEKIQGLNLPGTPRATSACCGTPLLCFIVMYSYC